MMAICEYCGKEMLEADGCDCGTVEIGKRLYDRYRVGDPGSMDEEMAAGNPEYRCHDCNAKFGEYHHPGCDMERCPACGDQFAFCDCPGKGIVVPLGRPPRVEE